MFTFFFVCLAATDAPQTPYETSLKEYNGRQTIFINGQPEAPFIYHLTGLLATEPWRPQAQEHMKHFAEQGYRLFGCQTSLSRLWTDDGVDISSVQRQIRAIRQVRDDAAVMLRLVVDAPAEWVRSHPEAKVGYTLTPSDLIPEAVRHNPHQWNHISYASEQWKKDAGDRLRQMLDQLGRSEEGGAVFALHICGGDWHEWFYPGHEFEPDNGPAMTQYFRDFLHKRYGSDQALQKAWDNPGVTLQKATVPGTDLRFSSTERMFRDPQRERQVIDYYQCHQELVAETPLYFCRIARNAWPRPVLIGAFQGYLFHLTHQAVGGHLEMERVLASDAVDFLSSPFSYEFDSRFLGGSGHFRCLTASVRLHGKLWINENDHPTLVGDHFGRPGPFAPTNIPDSIATMRRNAAHSFTLGQGMWWFDFGPQGGNGDGGWWDHPALLEEAGKELDLDRKLMEQPYEPAADVLLVYDTECFYYMPPHYLGIYWQSTHWGRTETLSSEALDRTLADAYKSGAVCETVHRQDLPLLDLTRYKVIVFAFTPYLDDQDQAFIKQHIMTGDRTVVWVYAPGYIDGKTADADRISAITGVTVARSTVNLPPQLLLRKNSLEKGFPETRIDTQIQDAWTAPTFQIVDDHAQTIGYYGGSREVAMARKQCGDTTVWYCALPLRNPQVLRAIFKQAGAHIYAEENDVLDAGGGVLWIHTETGGRRTITLKNGKKIRITLQPWSTVVLDAQTGDMLME